MEYTTNQLLRFTTAGSVDDGKSTLIGRLLLDSKSLLEDQLEAVTNSSRKKGFDFIDLSLITDGLRSEREQGITIDVAYRYFATPKRKFIIADTPGHLQYTRNMVTGASTANLAIVLIDARKGMVEQTCRHSFIASLLRIPHLVVCINKMDLVDYDEAVYNKIVEKFNAFVAKREITSLHFIPISALNGDNIVDRSTNMLWYKGSTLLDLLENVPLDSHYHPGNSRFPVQLVIRPQTREHQDYRGYAGRVQGGLFRQGDEVKVLPSGLTTRIKTIELDGQPVEEAFPPLSITMTLEDDLDISRGDMIIRPDCEPQIEQDVELTICWMNQKPLQQGAMLLLRHTTRECKAMVKSILYKIDVSTLQRIETVASLQMNDLARVRVRTSQPLFFDPYSKNRQTGSVILIDEGTNETVAAGMIS